MADIEPHKQKWRETADAAGVLHGIVVEVALERNPLVRIRSHSASLLLVSWGNDHGEDDDPSMPRVDRDRSIPSLEVIWMRRIAKKYLYGTRLQESQSCYIALTVVDEESLTRSHWHLTPSSIYRSQHLFETPLVLLNIRGIHGHWVWLKSLREPEGSYGGTVVSLTYDLKPGIRGKNNQMFHEMTYYHLKSISRQVATLRAHIYCNPEHLNKSLKG